MKAQAKILKGTRAGHTEVFSKPNITLGRHPESDIQFDPQRDLEASARHAVLLKQGDRWYVRDLSSRNGTFVNGHRITADTKLDDTDQIHFGGDGPVIEFRLVPEGTPDGVVAEAASAAPPSPVSAALRRTVGGMSTTQRIRIEVGRQTRKLRGLTVALFATLLIVAGFYYQNRRQERLWVAAIQARTDSIRQVADEAVRALRGQLEGLAARLRQSQAEVGSLQSQLAAAQAAGRSADVDALARELAGATEQLRFQQAAAQVNYSRIVDANQSAIAIIYVEFGLREVFTGTALTVRPDGTMLTNRHVVAGADGTRRPNRIAIQFADSRQVWRGRVLAVSSAADLAVVKAEGIRGSVPTIMGLNARSDTVRQGDPVALIGFPLGVQLPMSGEFARTSFWSGSVSKALGELFQIFGYGAEGASGTPIFDRNGEVIAILYGGQPGSGGRIVFGVPSRYAIRLLESLN